MTKTKSYLDQLDRFYAKDRQQWHQWLRENHETSPGIWLVYHKKNSQNQSISYDDAVEEALSFGWIDSKVNTLDDERYMQVFTPRKLGSNWSKLNKERIHKLIKDGMMQPAGLKKVETAKKDGSWGFLDDIENLLIPEDFKLALENKTNALKNFEELGNSNKKQILYWIATAKRNETRQKRIKKSVMAALQSKTPFQ
jgi:uncharacterized protein YdeI (YjbR/CyaY-like superfamily)